MSQHGFAKAVLVSCKPREIKFFTMSVASTRPFASIKSWSDLFNVDPAQSRSMAVQIHEADVEPLFFLRSRVNDVEAS